jgi:uracil-DNA glycosylase
MYSKEFVEFVYKYADKYNLYSINDFWITNLFIKNVREFGYCLYQINKLPNVCPPHKLVFRVLSMPPENINVVIIGQDPYPKQNVADGLAFSSQLGIQTCTKRIFDALRNDNQISVNENMLNGDLTFWERQGVFLLNTYLTYDASTKKHIFWENITNKIIELINAYTNNTVFMLWGNYAKQKSILINDKKHLILEYTHPSRLCRYKFEFCDHFSIANKYLLEHNKPQISWAE